MAGTSNYPRRAQANGFSTRLRDFTQGPRGPTDPRSYRALLGAGAPQTAGEGVAIDNKGRYELDPQPSTLEQIVAAAETLSLRAGALELLQRGRTFNYTTDTDYYVGQYAHMILADPASGDVTVHLPDASVSDMRTIYVKRIGAVANNVIVQPFGSQKIDAASSVTLPTKFDAITVICNGANWYIF